MKLFTETIRSRLLRNGRLRQAFTQDPRALNAAAVAGDGAS